MTIPNPDRTPPSETWEHYELYVRVRESVYALPSYFRTETVISGIIATDLFTLNATLGASIEEQVVTTLNSMRPIWDPEERYLLYRFVRQAQTFPDVLLKRHGASPDEGDADVLLGVELKGWYLLAKEGEPSFRFQVTPTACSCQDLIVVVPWALSNVTSGSPKVFQPYVELARYAAESRNYHWQELRRTELDTTIISPQGVTPYPKKSDQIADKPTQDPGGNFGRFARTGIMDKYLAEALSTPLCGLEARYWLAFLKLFQERRSPEQLDAQMSKIARQIAQERGPIDDEKQSALDAIMQNLKSLI